MKGSGQLQDPAALLSGKSHPDPLDSRLGGPDTRSRRNLVLLFGIALRIFGRSDRSLVAMSSELA